MDGDLVSVLDEPRRELGCLLPVPCFAPRGVGVEENLSPGVIVACSYSWANPASSNLRASNSGSSTGTPLMTTTISHHQPSSQVSSRRLSQVVGLPALRDLATPLRFHPLEPQEAPPMKYLTALV